MSKLVKEFALLASLAIVMSLLAFAHSNAAKGESSFHKLTAQDDTAALFKKTCAKCHGTEGHPTFRGRHEHAPNFTDPQWQEKVSDERLINSVTNGRDKMPAFGRKLSDAQITALVGYVRKFGSSGSKQ